MDIHAEVARLRAEAEAHPLKLPVNRRVDPRHRAISADGLEVWFTIQVSPHSRIQDALFERHDREPTVEECTAWLEGLMPGASPTEAPRLPGSFSRRFELFEREPSSEAPLA